MRRLVRFTQEELDEIKRRVSLADLVRRHGVVLNGHGKNLIGLCPFHRDTSPSLVITPEKNLWNCLGACGKGGDVIEWVIRAEKISFTRAVAFLKNLDKLDPNARCAARKMPLKIETPVTPTDEPLPEAERQKLLKPVVEFYQSTLKTAPKALDYLKRRRINHAEAIDTFKLGYSNRSLAYHVPGWDELRRHYQTIGIFRPETGHEHFSGCLVIPVIQPNGNIGEIYGRKTLGHLLRKGSVQHLYLPGPHVGVWNEAALAASDELILCEALIDALTFWCAGFRNVTASYGTNGFTPDHLAAIQTYGIKRVLIAYDRDDAGEKGVGELLPKLTAAGCEVFRVLFPNGQDANDVARSVKDPTDALGQLLRGAAWLGKGTPPPITSAPVSSPILANDPPPAAKLHPAELPPTPSLLAALIEPQAVEPLTPAPPEPPPEESPDDDNDEPKAAQPKAADPARAAQVGDVGAIDFTFQERLWRVRGLEQNLSAGVLKVSVRISHKTEFHLDTLDLVSSRQRELFLKTAARETGIRQETLKYDLARILRRMEELQDDLIEQKLSPKKPEVQMSEQERAEALAFLESPDLLDRIVRDFDALGIVGERVSLLTAYIATVSRKLEKPLSVLIQSSSASGKTAVMDAVLSLVPPEDVVKFSSMTGQALFYLDDIDLQHKILAIAEEEGAANADYAIKLLMSDGKLVIASTMKDPKTGNFVARQREKPGPTMVMMTTTNAEVAEEKANRMLTLAANEDRDQTRRIHELQRESQTVEGLLRSRDKEAVKRRHQNAQRLLRPLHVAIPSEYAKRLTFLDTYLRTRRDHMKYLTLILSAALLYQHQRPRRQIEHDGNVLTYIEATAEDIEIVNHLADEVLGRSLDEMSPQTRRLLMLIDKMVDTRSAEAQQPRADFRFSRRDVREFTGWTDFQVRIHMHKLEGLEYVLPHRGARGITFQYELLYDGRGKSGRRFCMGLIDVSKLKNEGSTDHNVHENPNNEGSTSVQSAPNEHPTSDAKSAASPPLSDASPSSPKNEVKKHLLRTGPRNGSKAVVQKRASAKEK